VCAIALSDCVLRVYTGRPGTLEGLRNHRIRRRSHDPVFRITTALVVAALLAVAAPIGRRNPETSRAFAAQIAALSEPDGYFDTDNLISNESAYLHVVPDLERRRVRGGAYIGVGPDQNFSYIAGVRPSIAFIVDIRRDNLLLHLLFKALFEQAQTRIEYLALLLGRAVPPDAAKWRDLPIDQLAQYLERPPQDAASLDATSQRLERIMRGFGVPLSSQDLATIRAFHRRFIEDGLGLRFQTTGRPPQSYYPTFRDLLRGTDAAGRQRNYLAAEESFQYIKSMQARDRVIPVVGDLSGSKALAGIARALAAEKAPLSAFYASNVEFYLERSGSYPRFLANLARLPHAEEAVVIRSVFNRGMGGSTSEVERIDELLAQPAGR
jgi:hypothetical protein